MKPIISPFYSFVVSRLSLFTDKNRYGLILNYIQIHNTDRKRISLGI